MTFDNNSFSISKGLHLNLFLCNLSNFDKAYVEQNIVNGGC